MEQRNNRDISQAKIIKSHMKYEWNGKIQMSYSCTASFSENFKVQPNFQNSLALYIWLANIKNSGTYYQQTKKGFPYNRNERIGIQKSGNSIHEVPYHLEVSYLGNVTAKNDITYQ